MQEEQGATRGSREQKALRALGHSFAVARESRGVFVFDRSCYAAAIERAGNQRHQWRQDKEGNQAKPLTAASSVASHRRIHFQRPAIDSTNEVEHLSESLIAQPVRRRCAPRPVVAVNDDLSFPVQ
jgi:hypothetical protein